MEKQQNRAFRQGNKNATGLARQGIELPVTLRCVKPPVGAPGISTQTGELRSFRTVSQDFEDRVDLSRMSVAQKLRLMTNMPTVEIDPVLEAAGVVNQSPRPAMVLLSVWPGLFLEQNRALLGKADGIVIDLESPNLRPVAKHIQSWIDTAYGMHKQVFAVGKPGTLARATDIRKRDVTTIPKTGMYEGLLDQDLATAISNRFQKMFDRIPRRARVYAETAGSAGRAKPATITTTIDPKYYERILTVQQEKEFDQLLNELDR